MDENTNVTTEKVNGTVESVEVDHVRKFEDVIFFTMTLNGVRVRDCRVVTANERTFISLPSRKGKDDKWFPVVTFRFSDEDQAKIIEMVKAKLAEAPAAEA